MPHERQNEKYDMKADTNKGMANTKKGKQKNGFLQIRFLCFIGAVILLLSACSIFIGVTPDKTYSSSERRVLAKRPALTKKSVLKGSFQKKFETYLCEQIPGRIRWVSLQSGLSRLLGNRDVNGVYFGKDGYLLERYQMQDFNWKQVKKNIRRVSAFVKKYPQARVMFVPVKSSVLAEKLPAFAQNSADTRFFELAGQIPKEQQTQVSDVLRAHSTDYIYYRTDHHWTSAGAFYAYEAWAEDMGFTPLKKDDFKIRLAEDAFLGTSYAKTRTGGKPDTIELYERKNSPGFELEYNMGEFQTDSFYDLSKSGGDDPYSVFLGGNQALIDVQNCSEDTNGKTLFIVKDSFGNCFAPLAAQHYARTVIADLRYINIPVHALLDMYPADDILILYNSAQFMEDKDIRKLK